MRTIRGRAGEATVDAPADLAATATSSKFFTRSKAKGTEVASLMFSSDLQMQPAREWCDTDFDTYQEMSVIDILGEVQI